MGQSLLLPVEVAALQNQVLRAYNQDLAIASSKDLENGVIHIDGYDYVAICATRQSKRRAYKSQRLCRKRKLL